MAFWASWHSSWRRRFSWIASNIPWTASKALSSAERPEVRPSRSNRDHCSSPPRSASPPECSTASQRRERTTSWTLALRSDSASRARASRSRRLRSATGSRTNRSAANTSGWFFSATMRWFTSFRSLRFFCPGNCASRSSSSASCSEVSETICRASSNSCCSSAVGALLPACVSSCTCSASSISIKTSSCLLKLLDRRGSSE
mmetsp:Transcript_84667/g.224855  ORF Transcript_84667/g.224855 Transcript_84667/m.224855 type:complete len:202 (+) Transcript_84667:699-1304(+)